MATTTETPLITVPEACRRIPGSRGAARVNPSTVARWILTGALARDGQRVRLRATRAGSRWLISPADLDAFFARLGADPEATEPEPIRSPAARRRDQKAVDARLDELLK